MSNAAPVRTERGLPQALHVRLRTSRGRVRYAAHARLYGLARTLEPDDPDAYGEAVRWESEHAEQGRPACGPPHDPLTVGTPHRIVYPKHRLRRSG